MMNLGKVGFIGRFKPLHNGGAVALETICELAEYLTIGIGSANKYDWRNPFTAQESQDMIDAFLSTKFSNYSFVHQADSGHIPEYADGRKWVSEIAENFGPLDYFITGNGYVKELLHDKYEIIHPATLLPENNRVRLKGTMVRVEMVKGHDWQLLVPKEVSHYLESNRLVERFQREFGLETIARTLGNEYARPETADEEKMHTWGY